MKSPSNTPIERDKSTDHRPAGSDGHNHAQYVLHRVTIILFTALLIGSNVYWHNVDDISDERYDELEREQWFNETIRPTSTIAEFYDMFRSQYAIEYSDDWTDATIAQMGANIGADLARHDIGTPGIWPYLESAYYEVTGSFSYFDARSRLNEFLNYSNSRTDDSPDVKMDCILKSINEQVSYVQDIHERYNFPCETLWLKSGDCDDYAILAAALFELVGIDSAFTLVYNSTRGSHAVVLVHTDSLDYYNVTCYLDLTEFGLSEGQWILIEPQFTMDMQFDFPGKSDIWTITAATEI